MKAKPVDMGSWQRDSRDEDLALFHDMRRRERRHFLYPLNDDVDASPRRDEGFSTLCMSASTPTRSGHDLLPLDSEKNDYDWLLTPPSTPLFPSLDQDVQVVNLSQRRILARSDSISKTVRLSYQQEQAPRIIHGGNPSPRRPSTASSTSSTISSSRGRPLSPSFTSRSSPTPRSSSPYRPSTPTRRNAATSAAASMPTSRSLTPTLRRNNTSPSPAANRLGLTNGRSRGKSLSPKLGPWEPSLPGFSMEPPPNLRTTLSDRTIQRGVSQTARNGAKHRTSVSEASEGSSRSLGCLNSHVEDGHWSLSYGNDLHSSQNSKASVISSCDDDADMADSVLSDSTRTSFDSGPRSTNLTVTKPEDPSTRRSVLPAKRQMKAAGSGDPMPFLSLTARKSYERQAAQRRSTQTMFRPLLSSVPITSIYSTRHGGMHLRTSSELCASQNGSSQLSKNEGSGGQSATGGVVGLMNSENMATDKEFTEKEAGGNSPLEGVMGCQSGSGAKDIKNLTDVGTPEMKDAEGSKKGLDGVQAHPDHDTVLLIKPLEDMACDMDADIMGMKILDDGCIEAECSLKGHTLSKEAECNSEISKVKDKYVEDHKLLTAVKPLSYLGAVGNVGSQHGAQRVLSDLGSFRRQSPMKNLITRSHDGSMLSEKSVSCDSLMSDSQSFIRSLASAFSNDELRESQNERQGDAMEADFGHESKAGGSKVVRSERQPSSLDSHGGVHSNENSLEPLEDASNLNADSVSHSRLTHVSHPSAIDQVGLPDGHLQQLHGLMNADPEASPPDCISDTIGESSVSNPQDKLSQYGILSILSSSAPSFALAEGGAAQHDSTESPNSAESRRFSGVFQTGISRLAADASEREHASQGQVSEVPSLKRSVTLEEATDTILFCSSIIHELVYKSVNLAMENEEQKAAKPSVSKRDFVTLFGFSGADHRAAGTKAARPRNRKPQPPAVGDAAVCETLSFVQKQRMVHRQTPAVTMRQSRMDRIENAIMGNHEEIHAPIMPNLQKRRVKQGKRVQCRCHCCLM